MNVDVGPGVLLVRTNHLKRPSSIPTYVGLSPPRVFLLATSLVIFSCSSYLKFKLATSSTQHQVMLICSKHMSKMWLSNNALHYMVCRHNVIVTASKVKKCYSFLALKTEN